MPEIVLIRGVPGIGKTTKAKTDYPDHQLMEADMYFEDDNGLYKYDASRVEHAHKWCQSTTKWLLDVGHDVVVANTFTRIWEMQPYFDMGYPVKVIEATGSYKNVHGVPSDAVQRMRQKFQAYPYQHNHT